MKRIGLALALLALAPSAAAARGPVYTLAPEARRIAVAADGSIYLLARSSRVDRWRDGRLEHISDDDSQDQSLSEIAAGGDGRLYAVDAGRCRVVRIEAGDRWVTVAGAGRCYYGTTPGSPAVGARLCYAVRGLVARPDRSLVVSDGCGRTLRIVPGRSVAPLAGWPEGLTPVRGLRGGTIAAAGTFGLYRVAPSRPPEALLAWTPEAFAEVDEGLLLRRSSGRLALLDAAGRLRAVRGPSADTRWDGDGDPLPREVGATDLARAPDGGWLIAAGRLRYVPPRAPRLLAVAIRRQTLPPRNPLRISLLLTQRADVTVALRVRGRLAAVRHARLGRGAQTISIPAGSRTEVNEVTVVARSGRRRAEDRASLLTGDYLPMRVAAWMAYEQTTVPTFYDWQVAGRAGCRRVGPRRVDCVHPGEGSCDGVTAIRVRRDGRLTMQAYDVGDSERCVFRRRTGRSPASVALVPEVPES